MSLLFPAAVMLAGAIWGTAGALSALAVECAVLVGFVLVDGWPP